MEYRLNTKKPHLACLILLISFPSMAAVLISPALPSMREFFHVSSGYAQQLITIFVLGYAAGQLVYSPFANRYGRKIAIYLGIGLYALSCFICLLGIHLHSLDTVLLGRFLMALGSSVGMIISFTIINDFYHPQQSRPVVSYTVLAYAFMPAIGIAIGGFITTHLTWIDCFYFYVFYGVFMLIIATRLPETLMKREPDALRIKPLLKAYGRAFATERLVIFSVIYGLMGAIVYIVATEGPFLGIQTIGLTPSHYGFLLLIPYTGQFIGAFGSGKISAHMSAYRVIAFGFALLLLGTLGMLIAFLMNWVNIYTFIFPVFFIMCGLPMIFSNVSVLAMVGYPDKATGSAIMTFVTMSVIVVAIFFLTIIPSKSVLVMPMMFCGVVVLTFILLWIGEHHFSDDPSEIIRS